jgi:hypothetical protein
MLVNPDGTSPSSRGGAIKNGGPEEIRTPVGIAAGLLKVSYLYPLGYWSEDQHLPSKFIICSFFLRTLFSLKCLNSFCALLYVFFQLERWKDSFYVHAS